MRFFMLSLPRCYNGIGICRCISDWRRTPDIARFRIKLNDINFSRAYLSASTYDETDNDELFSIIESLDTRLRNKPHYEIK